jgi:hypothetical protein
MMRFAIPLLLVAASVHAAPKVESFYPSGGQRGQTIDVTVGGSLDHWPLELWSDRPGLSAVADKAKGKLKVTISKDAAPGVHWVRLHDSGGASNLHAFVVGDLSEVAEVEPNDDPRKAQPITGNAIVNGKLEKAGDVDGFSVQLDGGQTLVASVMANTPLVSPMDGVLQLCTPDGAVLMQNDDWHGRDPQIVFTAPHSGAYIVRLFAFPSAANSAIQFAGGTNFIYRLTVTTGPFADFALPMHVQPGKPTELTLRGPNLAQPKLMIPPAGSATLVAADALELPVLPFTPHVTTSDSPQPAAIGDSFSGVLDRPGVTHRFTLKLTKNVPVTAHAYGYSIDSLLDPVILVLDRTGKQLLEADDVNVNTNRDAVLNFTPGSDGEYTFELRDVNRTGSPRHFYLVTFDRGADFQLTVPDTLTLAPGKTGEITVTIERQQKFDQPIEITAEDLPAGITAAKLTAGPKDKSAKLKLTAAPDAHTSGPIRVVGKSGDVAHAAGFAVPGRAVPHTAVWLTVPAKKN